MSNRETILEVESISKSYGPVQALNEISFELGKQRILGLVGDNGAGKSTLLKIIGGCTQQDSGNVFIRGEKCNFSNTGEAIKTGVAMTYQDFALADGVSIWENFFINRERTKSYGPVARVSKSQMKTEIEKKLSEYGFEFDIDKQAGELSGGQRRILVVSRAIESNPEVLLLDEPFRGLSQRAINQLWEILSAFTESGSVIITSQWYSSLMEHIDEVMVLRQGNKLGHFENSSVSQGQISRLVMGDRSSGSEEPEMKS